MTDVPHFSLPFRFATPQAAVNEQDSLEEIADCVLAILLCPTGFRVELPTFGIADPTFATPRVDTETLRVSIETWEPRAGVVLDERPDALDQLIDNVEVLLRLRSAV
jgi:phage baseplate assembly protein W